MRNKFHRVATPWNVQSQHDKCNARFEFHGEYVPSEWSIRNINCMYKPIWINFISVNMFVSCFYTYIVLKMLTCCFCKRSLKLMICRACKRAQKGHNLASKLTIRYFSLTLYTYSLCTSGRSCEKLYQGDNLWAATYVNCPSAVKPLFTIIIRSAKNIIPFAFIWNINWIATLVQHLWFIALSWETLAKRRVLELMKNLIQKQVNFI